MGYLVDEQELIGYKGFTNSGHEPFEVISFEGRNNELLYKVRFTNTGSEKVFTKTNILKGYIRDPFHVEGLVGYRGVSKKGGEFEVIGLGYIENEKRKYEVKFLNTGYVSYFQKQFILKGEIRDPYQKSILGVACIGLAKTRLNGKSTLEFSLWTNLINKCYNPNNNKYKNYGAKGVTVCERWRCFEYFLEDLPLIEGYEKWHVQPSKYQLDKDRKQQNVPINQKVYSLETCIFISLTENTLEMLSRKNKGINKLKGVYENAFSFYVRVSGDSFGSYTSQEAAANMYNHIAIHRGYPKEYLNDVPYMSRLECVEYRLERDENNKQMILIADRRHNNKIYHGYGDLGKAQMINITDKNKFDSFGNSTSL